MINKDNMHNEFNKGIEKILNFEENIV